MKRLLGAVLLICGLATAGAALEMGDDGLYDEPFFRDTFKDMREDLAEANAEGKRMVIFFEQRGCVYCHKMHEEIYSRDDVRAFIDENFYVVRLNLHSDTEMTDFDGEVTSEKAAARKWGILFTPTVLFLPEDVPEGVSAPQAAVAMMPGAFARGTTMDMYTWVLEKRYLLDSDEDFQRYHARMIRERNDGNTD
ncbi:thioredoxin family protein [Primorskyibacter flagellatus]|uniref:Thioredoxin-like domain-containing protein n=1 Tax=Primorskyibacter flagellatus TaxID=1387277 RepID=A0A1W2E3T0_9RHOB|nr:thioredoxin family protein [Primorskyibacter flagellatus]SMD04127.1 Thioredoxin-like domain-containing protein [Primorskyibacter flagellatus]